MAGHCVRADRRARIRGALVEQAPFAAPAHRTRGALDHAGWCPRPAAVRQWLSLKRGTKPLLLELDWSALLASAALTALAAVAWLQGRSMGSACACTRAKPSGVGASGCGKEHPLPGPCRPWCRCAAVRWRLPRKNLRAFAWPGAQAGPRQIQMAVPGHSPCLNPAMPWA